MTCVLLLASYLPRLPRRIATLPQRFQVTQVAQGIHALPKISMTIGSQLALAFEPALRQPDDEMLVGLEDQQSRTAVTKRNLAQIDPVF